MAKLPTTWTKLDLSGFDINQDIVPTKGINRQMLDVACDVLKTNRIAIRNRTVQSALKEIYGVGGSATDVCNLLQQWRKDNTAAVKEGKDDKDLVSAILESVDDGLLADDEIPEEFLAISKQIAQATYRLAYQNADTAISGDRLRQLSIENDTLRQQLKGFPQMQMELDFYQKQYERQQQELKDAYMQLNKQQLADSEQFQKRLDTLTNERNELTERLALAEARIKEFSEAEGAISSKERDFSNRLAELTGSLDVREQEVTSLQNEIQSLKQEMGEKQVLEKQLAEIKKQLQTANETITQLQAKQRGTTGLEVDVDIDQITADKERAERKAEELETLVQVLNDQISDYEQELLKLSSPVSVSVSDSDSDSVSDSVSVSDSDSDSDSDFESGSGSGSQKEKTQKKKQKQTA